MDTSGRAILLAGATVVIALLGMFATGVAFMYGLAIAAVIAVLLVLVASLTLLPALLAGASAPGSCVPAAPGSRLAFRRRAATVAATAAAERAAALGLAALERDGAGPAVAAGARLARADDRARSCPCSSMRLDSSDAGNDPASTSSRHAFDLLGAGLRARVQRAAAARRRAAQPATARAALPALRALAALDARGRRGHASRGSRRPGGSR